MASSFATSTSALFVAPLTTTYTPAPSCSTDRLVTLVPNEFGPKSIYGQAPLDCYAPGQGNVQQWNGFSATLYSPGLCPDGFAPFTRGSELPSPVTTRICCPNNWSWHSIVDFCYDANILWTSNWGTSITAAYPVTVAWEASDLSIFAEATVTTSTSTPTKRPTSPPETAAQSTSTSTTSANLTEESSSGMSVSTKAGIGIGVAIGIVALIVAVIFFLKRRRSRDSAAAAENYYAHHKRGEPTYTSEHRRYNDEPPTYEVYKHQKPAAAVFSELHASSREVPQELPGGWEGHEMRH